MAEAKKIALSNLADLRSDLGLTQDQMADAIKPMTRQTLGTIENGEAKDAVFLRAMFERLKVAFGSRFDHFDLVPALGTPGVFSIRYASPVEVAKNDDDFDRDTFDILKIRHKIGKSISGDLSYMQAQDEFLRGLHEDLRNWFEKTGQAPRLAAIGK